MTVKLGLDEDERAVLRSLPQQLLTLLDEAPDDPAVRRLCPPAYVSDDDAEFEAEYQRLMGTDLQDRHRAALATMLTTVDADTLTDDEAQAWLVGLNQLRLVLGTRLDVSEDDDGFVDPSDPRGPMLQIYGWLTYLQDSLIDQLSP